MNLTGKLLIAPPSVKGNFWQKTVIFVTEDHDRGSMGLVLNKESKMPIREFAQQNGLNVDIDGFVHVGGPVNVKALTLLHSSEWACGNTMRLTDHFSLSSSHDLLQRLSVGDCPNHWRLCMGLCAWAPDQLDSELFGRHPYNHNLSWLLATPNYQTVFGLDGRDQWTQGIEQSGMEFVQNILA
jgi:putative transcriptional regulator